MLVVRYTYFVLHFDTKVRNNYTEDNDSAGKLTRKSHKILYTQNKPLKQKAKSERIEGITKELQINSITTWTSRLLK
jgi:hypothetical protein